MRFDPVKVCKEECRKLKSVHNYVTNILIKVQFHFSFIHAGNMKRIMIVSGSFKFTVKHVDS